MDELIFGDGTKRFKVSISGIDKNDGTVTPESFLFNLFAFETNPLVIPLFNHSLSLDEAAALHSFLDAISLIKDRSLSTSGRFLELQSPIPKEVMDAFIRHPDLSGNPDLVRAVLTLNPDLCRSIIETELSAIDINSLAYRRDQLGTMKKLMEDESFFLEYQTAVSARGAEAVWQRFFENNQWIFGYALHYVIGEGVSTERLEQIVSGASIATAGKRADALLRSRGLLQSLCYVEIKTHSTLLLHGTEYRPDVWRPSGELVGAVSQSQKTVQLALEHLGSIMNLPVEAENFSGKRFFNYAPRAIVVCGRLNEFQNEGETNVSKFSSFELYRRSIHTPDIVTFDELYERAHAIVEASYAARS